MTTLANIPQTENVQISTTTTDNSYIWVDLDTSIVRIETVFKHPDARLPSQVRSSDAAYDVYSMESYHIEPGDIINVNTGVSVTPPIGYYFTVEGRSSLFKMGIVPFRGIIDSGYTGPLTITLMNVSKQAYDIKALDRIAQLILHKHQQAYFELVEEVSTTYNIRGNNGFGSSGR
jgi:dUTP pyrophosphatase